METAEAGKLNAEILKKITAFVTETNASLACWKLPGAHASNLVISEGAIRLNETRIEEIGSGFVFAPFNPIAEKLFLPATHLFEINGEEIKELTSGDLLSNLPDSQQNIFYQGPGNASTSEKENFLQLVSDCKMFIESGEVEKVVASRSRRITLSGKQDPIALFQILSKTYPNAMVSLVSTPEAGTWLGATPEQLITIDKQNIFRTVALAGTRKVDPTVPIEKVSWTQKEIEEQALVERYIISAFKKIRLREYDEFGPKTFRAGNLLHLKSVFEVNLNEVRYPDLGSVMLNLLHPTSAVCGMPRERSLQYLLSNEGYDRTYYAGYLGPVNVKEETHLFVNIRCMRWLGNEAILFAGAGITSESEPEAEANECDWKMATIEKLLI